MLFVAVYSKFLGPFAHLMCMWDVTCIYDLPNDRLYRGICFQHDYSIQ